MRPFISVFATLSLCASLAACDGDVDDGVVDVAFIGGAGDLKPAGLRMQSAAQHIYAAEAQGLVRLDEAGNVVPGLAERWIVTDDGRSYIFRIAEFDLAGGERLTAQAVRDSLRRSRSSLAGTSLGLDLGKIAEIRAMTGRVIEFRLTSPMPGFLQLLAQPEMGITIGKSRAGPMTAQADGDAIQLTALPPEQRGLPRQPGWEDDVHGVRAYAVSAQDATKGFSEGRYDLVLGGTVATVPLANGGALSRGTIRLDAAMGLLGFDVRRARGFLGNPQNREALAMAIDRAPLMQPFNIGGWEATSRLVAPKLAGSAESPAPERWDGNDIEARRRVAAGRVASWRATSGSAPMVAFYLPPGPGSDILFAALTRDLATVGISARRVEKEASADLALRDRVARYASPYWYLNQFNCRVSPNQCSPAADILVANAARSADPAEERAYLAEAESILADANLFIPLGAPIRWSLARASLTGFTENPWNLHPLFPLSRAPI